MNNFGEKVSFIWSVADLLRGPYRPNQYKDVMLPLVVLRRLDCVLEPTKTKVLAEYQALKSGGKGVMDAKLKKITKVPFYNTSKFTFEKLKGDSDGIAANLVNYIMGFSDKARTIKSSMNCKLNWRDSRSTSPRKQASSADFSSQNGRRKHRPTTPK